MRILRPSGPDANASRGRGIRRAAAAIVTFVCAVAPSITRAIPVPALDLDDLTQKSDLIILGELKSVTEGPEQTLHMPFGDVPCRVMDGVIRVSESLKSQAPAQEIGIQYCVPEEFIGWGQPTLHMYTVFFLSAHQPGPFVFADPYYPFAVAVPGPVTEGGRPIERVIAAIKNVVLSTAASDQQKLTAIYFLSHSKDSASTVALRSLLANHDENLRLYADEALIARNDIRGLDIAVEVLLNDPSATGRDSKNLIGAIAVGLKDPDAIPSLERLLASPNADIRRAATRALRNTASERALRALASRLGDSDQQTRYLAVIGLAEITGQSAWRPGPSEFEENEAKYLTYWKNWAVNSRL